LSFVLTACSTPRIPEGGLALADYVARAAALDLADQVERFKFAPGDAGPDGKVLVRVHELENQTSEHLNVEILSDTVREVLDGSGRVRCVAARAPTKTPPRYALSGKVQQEVARTPEVIRETFYVALELMSTETLFRVLGARAKETGERLRTKETKER
jgi:hypothetical protein